MTKSRLFKIKLARILGSLLRKLINQPLTITDPTTGEILLEFE